LTPASDHSPAFLLQHSTAVAADIFAGILRVARVLQMFVLGPRLLLSVREYHTKIMAKSEGGTGMSAIAFEAGYVPTDGAGEV
jgi:hypothetical protein